MSVKIFISYSQEDFFARGVKIKNYLSKLIPNSDVYIDQDKSKGQKWQEQNDEWLNQAQIVVVILTPAALQSKEVAREVDIAIKQKKRILACKDDSLDLPWKDVPWGLSEIEGITFEEDEVLKTRLYREVRKILKDMFDKSEIPVAVFATAETKTSLKHGDIPLIYNKRIFNLPYFVNEGDVSSLSAEIDDDAFSVIMKIVCNEETDIGITLPRTLIDSKIDLKDDGFFVLINGEDVKITEEFNEKERTIFLLLPKGNNNVEIIGNQLLGISMGVTTLSENKISILPRSGAPHEGKYLEPEILKIKQGDTVTWSNDDSAAHTITSGTPHDGPTGFFDSGLSMPGNTYKITFNNKGTFDYFCMVHPWKQGTIIVE